MWMEVIETDRRQSVRKDKPTSVLFLRSLSSRTYSLGHG